MSAYVLNKAISLKNKINKKEHLIIKKNMFEQNKNGHSPFTKPDSNLEGRGDSLLIIYLYITSTDE